jgi:spore coat polysaccharide biosynthesis predicted glycosyltransferase SpsG
MNEASLETSMIVIRADASIQMGSDHVMRCLTLADALQGSSPFFLN